MQESSPESIRLAMDQAWRDHQHTRDQTWRALQIGFLISAGIIGINWKTQSIIVAIIAGILVLFAALSGIQITLRHRNNVEFTKFQHILNCEKALGLLRNDLISNAGLPSRISFWDSFRPKKGNTAIFILRMHVAILLFAILFLIWRIICHFS